MEFDELIARKREWIDSPRTRELETIAGRLRDLFTIPRQPRSKIKEAFLEKLDARVGRYIDTQLPSGTWRDVLENLDVVIHHNATFWNRPFELAVAFRSPASRWHGDERGVAAATRAISWGDRFTKPGHEPWDNWWASDIGCPLLLANTLSLLEDDLSPEFFKKQVEHLYFLTHFPQHIGFKKGAATGTNATWVAIILFKLAVLANDIELARHARQEIIKHSAVNRNGFGEGLMPDGTWHQHGNGVNMGYGASHLETVAEYVFLARETSLELPPETMDAFKLFLEFANWISFMGCTDIYLNGRAATRAGEFRDYLVPFLLVRESGDTRFARDVDAFLSGRNAMPGEEKVIESHFPTLPVIQARFPVREPRTGGASALRGARAYPYSGYMLCRTHHHFVSVKAADQNLKTWFSIHDENKKGYHAREGTVFFLTPDHLLSVDLQFNRPWDSRMGVTRFGRHHPVKEQYGLSDLTACRVERVERGARVGQSGDDSCDSIREPGDKAGDHGQCLDVGILGMVHRLGIRKGHLVARKSYLAWDDFLYACTDGVLLENVAPGESSLDEWPGSCVTTLLAIPHADRISTETHRDEDGGMIKGRAGKILFATRGDNVSFITRKEVIDLDPLTINEKYPPARGQRLEPVTWFLLEARHDTVDSTSGCEIFCKFSRDGASYDLSGNFPGLQVSGTGHTVFIPALGRSFLVELQGSLLERLYP